MIMTKALLLLLLPLAALSDSFSLEERATPTCTPALASPKPKGLHCGDAGAVVNPQTISTSTKATQEACRDSCLHNKSCISFSYEADTQQCVLNAKTVNSSGFAQLPLGLTRFWNRHCYVCTCPSTLTKCGTGFKAKCIDTNDGDSCCNGKALDYTQSCCNGKAISYDQGCCDGKPTDLFGNPDNCGACGNKVSPPQTCCGYSASNLTDIYNCGKCYNYVGFDNSCCNGVGADLQTDKNNCGTCGFVCPSGSCEGGKCQVLDNPSFEINDGTTPTSWVPTNFMLINNYDQAYNGDYYLNLPGGTADGYALISQTFQNPYPPDTPVNWAIYLAVGQDFNAPDGSFSYYFAIDGTSLGELQDTCNTNEDYYCYTLQGGNDAPAGWRVATQSGSVDGFSATPEIEVVILDNGLTNLNSITDYIRFFITPQ